MAIREYEDENTGVRIFECDSWDDFIRAQRRVDGRCGFGHIFRGHAVSSWLLSSQFERWLYGLKGNDKDRNVKSLFSSSEAYEAFRLGRIEQFIDLVRGLPGTDTDNLSEVDWLALARHHGMSSYMLDWTRSPYIAAFFAFFGAAVINNPGITSGSSRGGIMFSQEPVAIWALGLYSDLEIKGEFEIVSSRHQINYWQKSQKGLFTALKHDVWVDVESYLANRRKGRYLEKYLVSGNDMAKALADLEYMNINCATMFPDYRGAAMQANISNPWRLMSH